MKKKVQGVGKRAGRLERTAPATTAGNKKR